MPTEYIQPSIPEARDELRVRLDYTKKQFRQEIPKSSAIAWVSFLWGATYGEMIGIDDLQALRALVPPIGYNPVEEMTSHPISPENRALIDASEEDDPIWSTPAEHAHRDLTNGLHFYGGRMPEHEAIAWYGYLQGQLEAGDLNESEHAGLVRLLPMIEHNPVNLITESKSAAKAVAKD